MQESDFKLSLKLRIDWSEMDTYLHVNNVHFIKYMQSARVQFWDITGLAKLFSEVKKGPILASTQCDFKHPLFFPGNVVIKTKVDYIKNSSFGLHHRLYNDDHVLCAEGKDAVVCYDFNSNKPFSITDDIRKIMQRYE